MLFALHVRHCLAGGNDDAGVLTGAADDRALEHVGVLDDVCSGEEAAHAVTKQEVGEIGILRGFQTAQTIHILNDHIPALFFTEEAVLAGVLRRAAVAEVIVRYHDKAVGSHELHEGNIALAVLRDTVSDLQDAADLSIGDAFNEEDVVFAVAGQKCKFIQGRHSNLPFYVL